METQPATEAAVVANAAAAAEAAPAAKNQPATGKVFLLDPTTEILIESDKSKVLYDKRLERVRDANAQAKWDRLLKSIVRVGIIQPVVVRKDGDKYAIIAGRQRVLAAREINEKGMTPNPVRVPAVLKRSNDLDSVFMQVYENEQRSNNTPIEQAYLAEKLLNLGASDEEVADALDCTLPHLKNNILTLLDLDPEVQKELHKGGALRNVQTAATALAGLARDEQKEAVKEVKEEAAKKGGKVKGSAVRKKAAEKKAKKTGGGSNNKGARPPKRDVRPSIKLVNKAFLGAMATVGTDQIKIKKNPMEVALELLGWVTGNNESEIAEMLVSTGDTKKAKEVAKAASKK